MKMNREQAKELSDYIDKECVKIINKARSLGCERSEVTIINHYGYSIKVQIKKEKEAPISSKEHILELYKSGMTRHEIANKLGVNYQYVCQCIRKKYLYKSSENSKWKFDLADELMKVGASPSLQSTIPNAFIKHGYNSLEDVRDYCRHVKYGDKPFVPYEDHKWPVSMIGKKSFYYLKKVFEK